MKVLETMKPAMKAKQIIIEFAIDRTWKQEEVIYDSNIGGHISITC